MILIVSKYLTPKGFRGLTVFPFVFVKNEAEKLNEAFLNHEKIHIRQQLELLIVPFFIWYGAEFLIRFMQLKDKKRAYLAVSFEKEAYENEKDFDYLQHKSVLSFLKYL